MRFFVLAAQIESGCGGEVSWLLSVEDVLHVEHATAVQGEANVTALELSDEHVQIEASNVESAQVAASEQLVVEAPGGSAKRVLVGYIGVGDAVYGGGFGGNR